MDQFVRLGISAVMIWAAFINTSLIEDEFSSTLLGVFGVLNAIVALVRFCPFYQVVGINTCGSSGD